MTVKAAEFEHLVKKLQFKARDTGDRHVWFEYQGKIVSRTKRSHGRGDLPAPDKIRQQLGLNEQQFSKAVGCHMSVDEYVEILKQKGKIPKEP